MIRLRILMLVVVAAIALPATASAEPGLTRVSLSSNATYVSQQQINLEVALTCPEGLFYSVGASVLQQQGLFTQVFGNGFTSGPCTGKHQKVAVSVFSFSFPGWQLGDALAYVSACSFTCDSTSKTIRIGL